MIKERWKRIRSGVWITVFVAMGVLEYIQLMRSFDLPQVMLVMPVIGALSVITLEKIGFFVPAGTILLSCLYQIVAGGENAVAYLQTNAASVARVILYVLPVCIFFEMIGMCAGALVRVLINRKRSLGPGLVCLALGLVLVFGPYLMVFHNPLYPVQARIKLNRYVEETYTDYKISEKNVYYSLRFSSYQCRVKMADGVIRTAGLEEDGTVTDEKAN